MVGKGIQRDKMKYLSIIENQANDLQFNGKDINTILPIVIICGILLYVYNCYFRYWFDPFHRHKISPTIEEYYHHIKMRHPDIWKEFKLSDEGIKELIQKMRDNENES